MNINDKSHFHNSPLSYWIASTDVINFPALQEDIKVDLAIIGGGLAGIQCAYQLQKEGLNIAVLEANKIGHGTTGHTTAKITSQHDLIYDKIRNQMGTELAKQYAVANETAIHEIKKLQKKIISIVATCHNQHLYILNKKSIYKKFMLKLKQHLV